MPVTNDKSFYFFDQTDVNVGANWTTVQSGTDIKGDPSNPNLALGVNEELIRVMPNGNPNFGFEVDGQFGVSAGKVTADWLETSVVQAGQENPDGQSYSSTVAKKDTFSSTRVTYGFDVGPTFRGNVGSAILDFNPYIGGRFGNYTGGTDAKYPAGTYPGTTELKNESYFVVGARGSVELGDIGKSHSSVGLVLGLEHGWGSTGLNVRDADGELITGQSPRVASQMTTATAGLRFTISNPNRIDPTAGPTPEEQAKIWAQGQEDEINSKYKAELNANGYSRVEINVYDAAHFPVDTTTPGVPDVSGWYYTIEPIYTVGTGDTATEATDGAFESDEHAPGSEIAHIFTTVEALKAGLETCSVPAAGAAADAPNGTPAP